VLLMTIDERKSARERCHEATDGPWIAKDSVRNPVDWVLPDGTDFFGDCPEGTIFSFHVLGGGYESPSDFGWYIVGGDVREGSIVPEFADLDFIAHARTDLPKALDAIDRLEAENADLRRQVAAMQPVVEAAEDWLDGNGDVDSEMLARIVAKCIAARDAAGKEQR
jgi:hypothetical protein